MKTALALATLCLLSACAQHESLAKMDSAKADDHVVPAIKVTTEGEGFVEYGSKMAEGAATPLASLAPLADQPTDKAVKVSGRIGQVCQAEGCWMMLTDGDLAVRVKFGDHAFVIPKDTQGNATVYGQFEVLTMTEDHARHMAEDAGQDPSKIKGKQREVRMIATSLRVEKSV